MGGNSVRLAISYVDELSFTAPRFSVLGSLQAIDMYTISGRYADCEQPVKDM